VTPTARVDADWLRLAHLPSTWEAVDDVPDEELWAVRSGLRPVSSRTCGSQPVRAVEPGDTRQYVEAAARFLTQTRSPSGSHVASPLRDYRSTVYGAEEREETGSAHERRTP
jgi:hypothetical protein